MSIIMKFIEKCKELKEKFNVIDKKTDEFLIGLWGLTKGKAKEAGEFLCTREGQLTFCSILFIPLAMVLSEAINYERKHTTKVPYVKAVVEKTEVKCTRDEPDMLIPAYASEDEKLRIKAENWKRSKFLTCVSKKAVCKAVDIPFHGPSIYSCETKG